MACLNCFGLFSSLITLQANLTLFYVSFNHSSPKPIIAAPLDPNPDALAALAASPAPPVVAPPAVPPVLTPPVPAAADGGGAQAAAAKQAEVCSSQLVLCFLVLFPRFVLPSFSCYAVLLYASLAVSGQFDFHSWLVVCST